MPKAYDDLVERLKRHPEVRNPYALANAIEARKVRARAARAAHRREKQEEGHNG